MPSTRFLCSRRLKVPSHFIPNRPQLETDFAMLVALIRVMTLVRVGFLTAGLPGDLADIFLTSPAVQSYIANFFVVYVGGAPRGTLVAGVCTRFMWRRLGSNDDWTPLARGPTSTEDKGYPPFLGRRLAGRAHCWIVRSIRESRRRDLDGADGPVRAGRRQRRGE